MRRTAQAAGLAIGLLGAALTGCASRPVAQLAAADLQMPAFEVAVLDQLPEQRRVLWSGLILETRTRADHTEFELLAYPVDAGQRPVLRAPSEGRFLARVAGFLEPLDYAPGRHLTLSGTLTGWIEGSIREHPYRYPLIEVSALHLWTRDFNRPRASWSFGIGVSF